LSSYAWRNSCKKVCKLFQRWRIPDVDTETNTEQSLRWKLGRCTHETWYGYNKCITYFRILPSGLYHIKNIKRKSRVQILKLLYM
jgi:hypothetical protein